MTETSLGTDTGLDCAIDDVLLRLLTLDTAQVATTLATLGDNLRVALAKLDHQHERRTGDDVVTTANSALAHLRSGDVTEARRTLVTAHQLTQAGPARATQAAPTRTGKHRRAVPSCRGNAAGPVPTCSGAMPARPGDAAPAPR